MVKKRRLIQQRLNEQYKRIQEEIERKATKKSDERMRKRVREEEDGGQSVPVVQASRKKPKAKRKDSKREKKTRRRMERLQSFKKQNFEHTEHNAVGGVEAPPFSGTTERTELPQSKRHRAA